MARGNTLSVVTAILAIAAHLPAGSCVLVVPPSGSGQILSRRAAPFAVPPSSSGPRLSRRAAPSAAGSPAVTFGNSDGDWPGNYRVGDYATAWYATVSWILIAGQWVSRVVLDTGSATFWVHDDAVAATSQEMRKVEPELPIQVTYANSDFAGPAYDADTMVGMLDLDSQRFGMDVNATEKATDGPFGGVLGLSFPSPGKAGDADDTSVIIRKVTFFTLATDAVGGALKQIWNFGQNIDANKIDQNALVSATVEHGGDFQETHTSWSVGTKALTFLSKTFNLPENYFTMVDTGTPFSMFPADIVAEIYNSYGAEGVAWAKRPGDGFYAVSMETAKAWEDIKITLTNSEGGTEWTMHGKNMALFGVAGNEIPVGSGKIYYLGPLQAVEGNQGVLGKTFNMGNMVAWDARGLSIDDQKNIVGCAAIRVAPLKDGALEAK